MPLQKSWLFPTNGVQRFVNRLLEAVKNGNEREIAKRADQLCSALSLIPTDENTRKREHEFGPQYQRPRPIASWKELTGIKEPGNLDELKQLMLKAGFSLDYVSEWQGTPQEVGILLLEELKKGKSTERGKPISLDDLYRKLTELKPEPAEMPKRRTTSKRKPSTGKWEHVWKLIVRHKAEDGIGIDQRIANEHNKLCAKKIASGKCKKINAKKVAQIRYEYKNRDQRNKR